jgi:hypothetical protein
MREGGRRRGLGIIGREGCRVKQAGGAIAGAQAWLKCVGAGMGEREPWSSYKWFYSTLHLSGLKLQSFVFGGTAGLKSAHGVHGGQQGSSRRPAPSRHQ